MNSNNIFIGNRYVPLLLGEWSDTTTYAYLSAVTYNGNGYVSKKNVPVGTLPTDTDYWVLWGSGSVLIDQLSNRVQSVESRLDGLETRVTATEGNITNIQAELLNHDSRLTFVTNIANQLASTVENLIKTQGKLIALSSYGKTTGQEITSGSAITVLWERIRAQNVWDGNVSINNANGIFTFNIPDPTKKYYLTVSANLTWSRPGGITDPRALSLRNNQITSDIVTIPCPDAVRNISLTEFYVGEITSATSLSILFRGFPSDAVSFSDPGDANFVTFKLFENTP